MKLSSVSGLDCDKAIAAHGGSVSMYEQSLRITARLLPEHIADLDALLRHLPVKEAWQSYMITLHGIKGVLNNIGAFSLGESAFYLEQLAKNNDLYACIAAHPPFIAALKEFADILAKALSDTETVPQSGNQSQLQDAIKVLEDAAASYDSGLANKAITSFSGLTYGQEADLLLDHIRDAFEHFDFVRATEFLSILKEWIMEEEYEE